MRQTDETENILSVIADLGRAMLMCGAEVSRVEDTILRLCTAYGFESADIFSITSLILVSVKKDSESFMQSRRVTSFVINLARLEELNALSRSACRSLPDADDFASELHEIIQNSHFSKPLRLLGFVLCAGAFTVFFGGSMRDALCAAVISVIMFFVERAFTHLAINPMLYNFTSSFIAGLSAALFVRLGFGESMDMIMIGDIMLLIPGLVLTNAIRDMMSGDTMSGFLRICEALLTTVAIALGFMLSLMLMGVIR